MIERLRLRASQAESHEGVDKQVSCLRWAIATTSRPTYPISTQEPY